MCLQKGRDIISECNNTKPITLREREREGEREGERERERGEGNMYNMYVMMIH